MKQKNRNLPKPCILDMDAPIELVKLKEETETKGELRCRFDNSLYEFLVKAYKCPCEDKDCDKIVVNIQRKSGLFVTFWLLMKKDFDEFINYKDFFYSISNVGFIASNGERQIIENEAKSLYGDNFLSDAKPACLCRECIKKIGHKEHWKHTILFELTNKLYDRDYAFMKAQERYDDDIRDLLDYVYDVGFSTGRTYSEYVGKIKIEPYALIGNRL